MDDNEAQVNSNVARLDERVKALRTDIERLSGQLEMLEKQLNELTPRLNNLEYLATKQQDRWEMVAKYMIQTAWIILLAWAMMKLNLSAPPIN